MYGKSMPPGAWPSPYGIFTKTRGPGGVETCYYMEDFSYVWGALSLFAREKKDNYAEVVSEGIGHKILY
jgi:hypothetical protein